jgi:hypothetical protein
VVQHRGVRRFGIQLVFALPLLAVATVGGYAWKGAPGAAIGFAAILALETIALFPRFVRFIGTRRFQRLSPVLITVFAAAIGYAEIGVFGLVFLTIVGGVGSWIGYRLGQWFIADNERWLAYRRSPRDTSLHERH